MATRERATTLGLNTDLPPDRLEERAFDLRNMVPASPISARPRAGCPALGTYSSATLGRQLVIDNLPARADRTLILAINNRDDGEGGVATTIEGLAEFEPKTMGGSTAAALGSDPGQYGWGDVGLTTAADYLWGWIV